MRRLLPPMNNAMMLAESWIDIELRNHFLVLSSVQTFTPISSQIDSRTWGRKSLSWHLQFCRSLRGFCTAHTHCMTIIETVLITPNKSFTKTGADYSLAAADLWLLVKQGKFSFWEDAGPTKCCSVFVLICSEARNGCPHHGIISPCL